MKNKRGWLSTLLLGIVLLLASSVLGCQAPPLIVEFSAVPSEIESGESATLFWSVTEATSISIDQGIDDVSAVGVQTVSPMTTTAYTLTASNAAGTVTKSVVVTVTPAPPVAPEDVLSIWHSPPSPQGFPPTIAENFTVGTYGSSYDAVWAPKFYIENYQWIDIIVKSKDLPIWFSDEIPGTACFAVNFEDYDPANYFMPDSEDLGYHPGGDASPFVGKILYENRETYTPAETIYSTGVRLCSPYPIGYLIFHNYNVYEEAEISYQVYKLDVTPEWGFEGEYHKNTLVPWLQQVPESEAEELYQEWRSQFK